MGRDKARLRIGSKTLLGHIQGEALKLRLPVRIIRRDLVPRCGPLGGIYTALKTSAAEAELFLACDMPFVSAGLLESLVEFWTTERRPAFIVSQRTAGFPFVVPVEAFEIVENQMLKKIFSLQKLAEVLKGRLMHAPVEHEEELFNVNTSAEWRAALRRWKVGHKRAP
jgi:molybdopterin-guanine dinucleotide biosynthesis protein A